VLPVVIAVYAVGVVICARLLAGHHAWKWKSQSVERPELLDWLTGWLLGLAGGLVWPVFLLRAGAMRLPLPAVGAERDGRRQLSERDRQREIEATKERLAELERETGLS
jgi:hypothetical protein